MSDRETLVLFHGLTMSGRVWHTTRPFLTRDFDVVTPTALAHAGADARRSRAILPLAARVPPIRRFALRTTSADGARVAPAEIIAAVDDLLGCTVLDDLLSTTEALAPLDAPNLTVAWSGSDALLLPHVNGAIAKQLIPGANHITLPGVGHVPMLDDPALVAATIRATIAQQRQLVRTLTA
jgi:pimeloyl-ACP methyl ester carboxylesterase